MNQIRVYGKTGATTFSGQKQFNRTTYAERAYFPLWGTINADGSIDKLRRYSKVADRSYYARTFVKLRQTARPFLPLCEEMLKIEFIGAP